MFRFRSCFIYVSQKEEGLQSLRSTARLSDAANDNDNDDDNCDFIVVDLCVMAYRPTSFAAKMCNISASIFWVGVDFGYELVWVRVGIGYGLTWVRVGIGYELVVVFNYLLVTQCFVNNGLADKTSTEPGLGTS